MDPIVGAIVTPVVESLMVRVKKQLNYLIFCLTYVRDMHTKMEELNDTKFNVENRKDMNKRNSLHVPAGVPRWLEEVGKIDVQVKTIDSDVGSCLNLIGRYNLGRKAFKINQNIDRLKEKISGIDWTEIPIVQAEVNNASFSAPLSDYEDFESRKPIYKKALNALKVDSKPHMIALCGMGGVGKTTMMKNLQKDVREKAMFDFIIEVAIGENMEVSIIQKAVAEQLSIDLNESTKEARAGKLRNGFKTEVDRGKKKFLVILDDVWQSVDLNDIGLSPKPNQGIDFKVLMTSRDKKVCIMMGVELDSILDLEVIEESEAQGFFFQFVSISDDVDLDKIGRDITNKCKGLPIAIKTIARALKYESKHVWEDTLTKLEHKINAHEVVGEVFTISYKHLQDEETRLTLLLCGLYPEDFDIPTEDLMRYGWGLKMFQNVDTISEARNRLNTCITRLVHANLLIRSQKVGCVKMHDLVRAFVLDVCSKSEHSSVIGNKWPTESNCKKISLTCTGMHDFGGNRKYPNLLLLKLMHGDESLRFPEDFYEEKKKLEVIAFDEMKYPLHFRSLDQCSANLRTLCLHQCSLMSDCSSIGNFLNLEVLSFAGSSIHELPSTIVNLKELKLLDLTDCKYLCVDDGILKSLVKLEELYMRGTRRKVNAEGNELVEFSKNLDALEIEFFDKDALPQNLSFKNLKRFRISLGCRLDKIYGVSRYSFENTLMLVTNDCELSDSGTKELFEKTEVIYLCVEGINDIGDGLGASLHNLRVLHISKCRNLTYLFTVHVANGLKQLERFEIDECPVLETLVDSHEICQVEVIKFPALKFLSLEKLPMLMSLCNGGNAIELPLLEELELDSLPKIISIHQHFLKKEVMRSKLKKLKIFNMEKLTEIWPSELSNNDEVMISQLREITVEGCESLVNLFPSNPMSLLRHLEQLTVGYCSSIDVLFNIDLGSSSSSNVGEIEEGNNNSNLRSIHVESCWELREVWRVKGVNNSNSHLPILGFQTVESLHIRRCKRLRNVFTPTTSNFDMRSLKKIFIRNVNGWEVNKSIDEEINVTSNQDISQVDDDNVAFPSYLIHTFHQLHALQLWYFKEAEVVFKIDSSSCRNLATTHNNQQLPHLKDLDLSFMERMSHVWKYDWNQLLVSQQQPKSSSFLNITNITLYRCGSIKYLFSPLMAKLLSNLIKIEIRSCDAMEEVVSKIDVEDEEMDAFISLSSHTNTTITFFPHLESLILWDLPCLKRIDGVGNNYGGKKVTSTISVASSVYDKSQCYQVGVAYWSSYQYAKTISIRKCDALLTLIPSHVGHMPNLEKLTISYCDSLREIFESDEGVVKSAANIGDTIPRPIINLTLPNLQTLHIDGCNNMEYIFTSCVLESLKKLQELKIEKCYAIQVIVKHEDDQGLEDVVFPHLTSLTLVTLPNLKGFFLGKNEFRWPLLDEVKIYGCPQMMIFTPGLSKTPKLKYMNTGLGKHSLGRGLSFDWTNENQLYNSSWIDGDIIELLQFPWSFSNLIEVNVSGYDHGLRRKKTIFPSNELVNVGEGGDIEEADDNKVFEDETQSANNDHLSNKKELLMSMDHPPTSSSYIWKSKYSSNLSNLTKVSLEKCYKLEHVLSYGMAATLVQLQHLHISDCKEMKVIVEAVKEDSANKVKVVSFPCLKSLQLTSLKSLKGFCLGSHDEANFELPSLHTLKITECSKIRVFTNGRSTTPKLKVIETGFGLCEVTEDLNSFIRTKLQEGYKF